MQIQCTAADINLHLGYITVCRSGTKDSFSYFAPYLPPSCEVFLSHTHIETSFSALPGFFSECVRISFLLSLSGRVFIWLDWKKEKNPSILLPYTVAPQNPACLRKYFLRKILERNSQKNVIFTNFPSSNNSQCNVFSGNSATLWPPICQVTRWFLSLRFKWTTCLWNPLRHAPSAHHCMTFHQYLITLKHKEELDSCLLIFLKAPFQFLQQKCKKRKEKKEKWSRSEKKQRSMLLWKKVLCKGSLISCPHQITQEKPNSNIHPGMPLFRGSSLDF